MWAGGRLAFHAPLPLGRPAARVSTVVGVAEKTGRRGPLTFVTVRHEIFGAQGLAVTEEQDIVYREDPEPGAVPPEPPSAPGNETCGRAWTCDPVLLFRYSALTFNGHRIHYDADYARSVEGYPGLVVHGPLLATLLLELAAGLGPPAAGGFVPLARFAFRATAPVFAGERFETCARPEAGGLALWVRGADGRLAMTAEAAW
jgi:3-methylfumaryl-CoA hydratase